MVCTHRVSSYNELFSSLLAQQCQPRLLAPQNGDILCDGDQVTKTTCNFLCDPGYSLVGSMERTCQPNNSWNGSNTSCDIMLCEELQSPNNGFVVLPCNREFQSGCNLTCEDGYYSDGPCTQSCEVNDDGIVQWSMAPVCKGICINTVLRIKKIKEEVEIDYILLGNK